MTVPIAGETGSTGLIMPKLKYRFRVMFTNMGVTKPTTTVTKQVMTVTRPSVSFEDITIDIYNSKLRLAGKHSWEDVTIEVRDDAQGAVAALVGEQLQKQLDFSEQASAASGMDYKFQCTIEILDGGNGANAPAALEVWELYGCYLQAVNYNDLTYADSAPVTITLTLRFDNAVQTPLGSGLGTAVARTVNTLVTGVGSS